MDSGGGTLFSGSVSRWSFLLRRFGGRGGSPLLNFAREVFPIGEAEIGFGSRFSLVDREGRFLWGEGVRVPEGETLAFLCCSGDFILGKVGKGRRNPSNGGRRPRFGTWEREGKTLSLGGEEGGRFQNGGLFISYIYEFGQGETCPSNFELE